MPREQVIDIPVRALNVKLGNGDAVQEEVPAPPKSGNKINVENTITRLVRDQSVEKQARTQSVVDSMEKAMAEKAPAPATEPVKLLPLPKTKAAPPPAKSTKSSKQAKPTKPAKPAKERKFDLRSEGVATSAPVVPVTARQFVRDSGGAKVDGAQSATSVASSAEVISRYEQMISMWIQKFKLYPDQARQKGMQGNTTVRIRIDRRGNVRYYALENSTGHTLLDRAAIDMIRRANPVPAVPAEYPQGDLLEFLIPVNFQLQ